MGWKTLPSNCCTAMMIASTISASVSPLETSAMSTATKPAKTAPTIGTNAETNVSTASGSTRGTSRIHRPMPMRTASSRPTNAWDRTNEPSVFQQRSATTGTSVARRPGSWRRSHGRKRGPSFRKKNMRKRARIAVIRPLKTVLTPVTAVLTTLPALFSMRSTAASKAPVIWASLMFSGGPAAQSRSLPMPSTTPSASSPDCEATGTAMSAMTPLPTRRNITVTSAAAGAGRHPWLRRKRAKGQVSVVRSRPTMRGHTTDHVRPSSHRVTVANNRTSSSSSETRADLRSAAAVFSELNEADMGATL
ncbi:exported protein of unknown function [Streptomyces sp. KY70]|nr:exported protein of unknown function [Streptomyces sp. KY70]